MHFKYLKQIPGNHGDWRIDFLLAFSVFPYQGINLSGFSKTGLQPLPATPARGAFILFHGRESERVGWKSG